MDALAMRGRLLGLLLCLGSPLADGVASAASRLFVSDSSGVGQLASFGDGDGTFTATLGNGGVDVFFDAQTRFFQFRMTFISGDGSPPAPGTYGAVEDASAHPPDGRPHVFVTISDEFCYDFGGFFVVHELVLGTANDVLASPRTTGSRAPMARRATAPSASRSATPPATESRTVRRATTATRARRRTPAKRGAAPATTS